MHVARISGTVSNMGSQRDPRESADPQVPNLEDVMVAITTCQAVLTNKIEEVQLDMGLMHQNLDKILS